MSTNTNTNTNEHAPINDLGRLGAIQAGALEIYVLDVAHEPQEALRVQDGRLIVLDREAAFTLLCDAANSADADVERLAGEARKLARADRDALQTLAKKVLDS